MGHSSVVASVCVGRSGRRDKIFRERSPSARPTGSCRGRYRKLADLRRKETKPTE